MLLSFPNNQLFKNIQWFSISHVSLRLFKIRLRSKEKILKDLVFDENGLKFYSEEKPKYK